VAELLARIDSRELSEWQAVFVLEAAELKQHELMARAKAATPPPRRPLRRR